MEHRLLSDYDDHTILLTNFVRDAIVAYALYCTNMALFLPFSLIPVTVMECTLKNVWKAINRILRENLHIWKAWLKKGNL